MGNCNIVFKVTFNIFLFTFNHQNFIDIVVIDSYLITKNIIKCLQEKNLLVIFFDDLKLNSTADIVIDYSPNANENQYFNSKLALLGPKYFITDSKVLINKNRNINSIIAHAGGSGLFENAPLLYKTIADFAKQNYIDLTWLCPNQDIVNKLKKIVKTIQDDKIIGWVDNTSAFWNKFDLVVGPPSTSLYEVLMQVSLPVSFPISNTQISRKEDWIKLGHLLHLDFEEIQSSLAIYKYLDFANDHYLDLKSILRSQSYILDNYGVSRILEKLINIENKTALRTSNQQVIMEGSNIRECNIKDAFSFLLARNSIHVRKFSTDPHHVIKWIDHIRWWIYAKDIFRFVLTIENEPKAYFWHSSKCIDGRNYLIGGWFPVESSNAFPFAIKILNWQLKYCDSIYPNHIWIATIQADNQSVIALNRRFGFVDASSDLKLIAKELFPGTTDDFIILQRP